eukprot:5150014-Amphidinium_carterae.1
MAVNCTAEPLPLPQTPGSKSGNCNWFLVCTKASAIRKVNLVYSGVWLVRMLKGDKQYEKILTFQQVWLATSADFPPVLMCSK